MADGVEVSLVGGGSVEVVDLSQIAGTVTLVRVRDHRSGILHVTEYTSIAELEEAIRAKLARLAKVWEAEAAARAAADLPPESTVETETP